MTTKQLRNKILDLAIHGHLVPQDANDEPASTLLARIRAEKEQLVKEGKLKKKDLVTTPVSDEDKPFEVPEGWEWVTVKDICSKFTTGPFGSMVHKTDYVTNGGVPLVNPANMIDGKINMDKMVLVSVSKAEELQRYKLEPSDILLARRGDLTKCVIVNEPQIGWLCGTGSFVLHAILLNPRFFAKLYSSTYIQSILKKECVGATMDNLNQGLLGSLPIPLPPLSEQHRIVAAIEQWMSLVDIIESGQENLQQSIALAKNKILDLAIKGKLVEKEGEWEEKPLKEIATVLYGYPFDSNLFNIISEGMPLLRIRDVVPGFTETYTTEVADQQYIIHRGDMLIGMDGNFNVGFWASNDAYLNQRVCKVTADSNYVLQRYLSYQMQKKLDELECNVSYSTVKHLSDKHLTKMTIPLPPLSEQHRIVSKIEELFAQLDTIANALT